MKGLVDGLTEGLAIGLEKDQRKDSASSKQRYGTYSLFRMAIRKICEDANKSESYYNRTQNEGCERARIRNISGNTHPDFSSLSPFRNTRVIELQERNGYGFALKHALIHYVQTP